MVKASPRVARPPRHGDGMKLATYEPEELRQRELAQLRYDYAAIEVEHRGAVQAAAMEIRRRQRRMAEDMVAIGERLLTVRELLPHGQFASWWQVEFGYSTRMVQEFMNVARRFGPGKCAFNAHLHETSLRLLAAPSVPEEAIEDAVMAAEQKGRPLTVAETKEIIELYKPPPKQIEVKATRPVDPAAFPLPAMIAPVEITPEPPTLEPDLPDTKDAAARVVRALVTGAAGEVHFEWNLEHATEAQLAAALGHIAEVEEPEDFREVRAKIAARLSKLMEARATADGNASLVARLVAFKDLLYEIDEKYPDIHRMTADVRPPLNRLITSVQRQVK